MNSVEPKHFAWIASHIVPHEAGLRRWLRYVGMRQDDVDDIVQEVYCRILHLGQVDHILDAKSYLFRSARNVMMDQVRKTSVVPIGVMQSLDEVSLADDGPSPEHMSIVRSELSWVMRLIAELPQRCRQVFELRKIHGQSQAQTAAALKLSENVVEKETVKGLTLILQEIERAGRDEDYSRYRKTGRATKGVKHVTD